MSCKLHAFEESYDKSPSLHNHGSLEKALLRMNASDVAIYDTMMQEDMVIA